MPLFLRKFIIDFIETGLAAILALNIAFPTTTTQAQATAIVLGSAIAGAFVSAFRRNVGAFLAWLRTTLKVTS